MSFSTSFNCRQSNPNPICPLAVYRPYRGQSRFRMTQATRQLVRSKAVASTPPKKTWLACCRDACLKHWQTAPRKGSQRSYRQIQSCGEQSWLLSYLQQPLDQQLAYLLETHQSLALQGSLGDFTYSLIRYSSLAK